MSERLDPEAYAAKMNEWARGTMVARNGTRFLRVGEGRAEAELDFRPELTQLTGLVHAGAIMALADETATAAAMWELNPSGVFDPARFPLTIQFSANLIGNQGSGKLVATAEILHRGRTTLVVEVRVHSGEGRLLARAVATQLVPAPRG